MVMAVTIAVALPPLAATAQTFPSKPIRMVVAFPPGGGTDIVARIIGAKLTESFRQQVIVDNRAGADGIIGTEIVARANPDGHVMFMGTAGNLAINPALYGKARLTFDIARDLMPVTQVVSVDMLLTVHPALPAKTAKELIALARAKPGALNYASTGIGGLPHLAMELFNHMGAIKLNHVPYKGGGPAMVELIGGQVQVFVQSLVQSASPVKEGRVRALAVLGPKRAPLLPDVPVMSDTLPGFEATNWYGLMIPARTPAAIHQRIYVEMVKAVRAPDIEGKIVAQGATPVMSTPAEFAVFLKSETTKWSTIIKSANVRAD